MADDAVIQVSDNRAAHRFEVTVGGQRAGLAVYRQNGDTVTMTHTEIDGAHEGQGLGSALIRGALDDLRGRGALVCPECPFVRTYIQRHLEYLDLVPAEERLRFDLPEAP